MPDQCFSMLDQAPSILRVSSLIVPQQHDQSDRAGSGLTMRFVIIRVILINNAGVQEVQRSRKEALAAMVLPEPAAPLSKELLAARRLLGRTPVTFRPVKERTGKTIVSLDAYITRLEEAKYSQLGL